MASQFAAATSVPVRTIIFSLFDDGIDLGFFVSLNAFESFKGPVSRRIPFARQPIWSVFAGYWSVLSRGAYGKTSVAYVSAPEDGLRQQEQEHNGSE